jgi:hypothetical protein
VLEPSTKRPEEGTDMSHIIEEESGTYVPRLQHSHNGYFAGDFSTVPFQAPDLGFLLTTQEIAA